MRTFRAILWHDVVMGLRSSGGAALSAAFFALIVLLTPFGLGPDTSLLQSIAPGLFWIAALLATLLGLERVVQPDVEDGTLDLLRLSPLPMELVIVAKILAHWITSGLIISLLAPILAPMLNLATQAFVTLALSLLIGSFGLSAIGAAAAALGASVQRGGIVLAIMVLPLNIPFLIFGASAVSAAQAGGDPYQPLMFLSACTLIATVIGPVAAAAALRLNED
jgi:heme exporter protein B